MTQSSDLVRQTDGAVKRFRHYIIIGIIAVIVLLLSPIVYTAVVLYGGYQQNNLTKTLEQWLPYPAVLINRQWITYQLLEDDINQIERINQLNADYVKQQGGTMPTRQEIVDSELERLIDQNVLQQSAQTLGITVMPDEIDNTFNDEILPQAQGDEQSIEQTLQELYGWSIADFKAKVVSELVLRQKVYDYLMTNNKTALSTGPKAKIELIQQQLNQDSNQFVVLAQQNSEDGSAALGGDLDWIKQGDTVPEFEQAAFALTEPNQLSSIIETKFGYHLIQLIERKAATDTELEQVHVRHILIKYSLDDYLKQQRNSMYVKKLVDPAKV